MAKDIEIKEIWEVPNFNFEEFENFNYFWKISKFNNNQLNSLIKELENVAITLGIDNGTDVIDKKNEFGFGDDSYSWLTNLEPKEYMQVIEKTCIILIEEFKKRDLI